MKLPSRWAAWLRSLTGRWPSRHAADRRSPTIPSGSPKRQAGGGPPASSAAPSPPLLPRPSHAAVPPPSHRSRSQLSTCPRLDATQSKTRPGRHTMAPMEHLPELPSGSHGRHATVPLPVATSAAQSRRPTVRPARPARSLHSSMSPFHPSRRVPLQAAPAPHRVMPSGPGLYRSWAVGPQRPATPSAPFSSVPAGQRPGIIPSPSELLTAAYLRRGTEQYWLPTAGRLWHPLGTEQYWLPTAGRLWHPLGTEQYWLPTAGRLWHPLGAPRAVERVQAVCESG